MLINGFADVYSENNIHSVRATNLRLCGKLTANECLDLVIGFGLHNEFIDTDRESVRLSGHD